MLDKNPDTNSAVGEAISALIDDQANDLDMVRVLKELDSDESVRDTWRRYHMASAVMKSEGGGATLTVDLSDSIRESIALEPTYVSKSSENKKRWVDLLTKSSIAATVTVGLLFGAQQFTGLTSESVGNSGESGLVATEPFIAPDLNSAVVPAGFDAPRLSARTVSTAQPQVSRSNQPSVVRSLPTGSPVETVLTDPELQAHFDRLMMIHAEQSSSNSDLSVISFARLTDLNTPVVERDLPKADDLQQTGSNVKDTPN